MTCTKTAKFSKYILVAITWKVVTSIKIKVIKLLNRRVDAYLYACKWGRILNESPQCVSFPCCSNNIYTAEIPPWWPETKQDLAIPFSPFIFYFLYHLVNLWGRIERSKFESSRHWISKLTILVTVDQRKGRKKIWWSIRQRGPIYRRAFILQKTSAQAKHEAASKNLTRCPCPTLHAGSMHEPFVPTSINVSTIFWEALWVWTCHSGYFMPNIETCSCILWLLRRAIASFARECYVRLNETFGLELKFPAVCNSPFLRYDCRTTFLGKFKIL